MNISITFFKEACSAEEALKTVLEQCEDFLQVLEEAGFSISKIEMFENSLDRESFDGEICCKAQRQLVLRMAYSTEVIQWLMEQIRKNGYQASLNTVCEHSDTRTLDEELIRLAIMDAEKKAEAAADTLNRTITGIHSVRAERSWQNDEYTDWMEQQFSRFILKEEPAPCLLSVETGAPLQKRSQSAVVTFLTD